jgi:hypothetical protein
MQAAMAARRVVMSASFLNSKELRQIHPLALVIGLINSQAGKMYHAWGLRRLSCSDWIFTLADRVVCGRHAGLQQGQQS